MARLLSALGTRVGRKQTNGVMAKCPAHDDRTHSLSVQTGFDGKALLNCHAGCKAEDVVDALGIKWGELFPDDEAPLGAPIATYRYTDERGTLLYEVLRFHPKTFRPRRATGSWGLNGTRRVLYRLPDVVSSPPRAVWVVEGEKDADKLAEMGMVSTTCSGGAHGWRDEYADSLRHRHVMVVPDNDEAGFAFAESVSKSCLGVAASVRIVVLPGLAPKQDVSDYVRKGGKRADLEALAKACEPERTLPELRSVLKDMERRIREAEADIKRLKGISQ